MLLNVMKMIDVHAHLDHARFEKDLDEVIRRFRKEGGKYIISSGVNPATNRKALEIAKKYDAVKVSFGIYPVGNFGEDINAEINWIKKYKDDCIAIGEIGLDYDDDKRRAESEMQKELFEKMLNLAKKIGKMVIIHSRKAELNAIEILEEMKMKKVVMHCFCGKKSLIRRCVGHGWSFSVPPVIARLEHFKMLVKMVPMGQLLTETDAPYLSPVVGTRNESANVAVTIKIIAEIKGLTEDEVAGQIFINAKRLFKL